MLLESFFLLPPPRLRSIVHSSSPRFSETNQLPEIPLTLEEIRHAIFKASLLKRPGEDGLPTLVWKNYGLYYNIIFLPFLRLLSSKESYQKLGKSPKLSRLKNLVNSTIQIPMLSVQ